MTTLADSSYLDRMLSFIGEARTVDALEDGAARVESCVRRLGQSRLAQPYGPGKWTGLQVLAHLADAEQVVAYRARQVLTQDPHRIQEYDEGLWAELYPAVDAEVALQAFLAARRWNLHLVRSLTPAQFERVSVHPRRGDETLGTTLRSLAGHTFNHLRHLESVL